MFCRLSFTSEAADTFDDDCSYIQGECAYLLAVLRNKVLQNRAKTVKEVSELVAAAG